MVALDDSAVLEARDRPQTEDPTALHAVYPLMEKSKHGCCAGTFFVGVLSVDMWSAGLAPGSSSLRSSLRAWPWGLYGFTLYEVFLTYSMDIVNSSLSGDHLMMLTNLWAMEVCKGVIRGGA